MTNMEIKKLLEIGIAFSSEKDYNRLLEQILTNVMVLTRCDAGILYLKEDDYLCAKIMRNNTLKFYEGGDGNFIDLPFISAGEESDVCAHSMKMKKIINVADVYDCNGWDLSDLEEYDRNFGYQTHSLLVIPMKNSKGEAIGALKLLNVEDLNGFSDIFKCDREQLAESVAALAAIAIENRSYIVEVKNLFDSFVQVLSTAIDEKSPYNAAHTWNMVKYGSDFLDYINKEFNDGSGAVYISPSHKEEILMSIWLHDIGKLVIPREIMNKSTRLGARISLLERKLDVIMLQTEIDMLEKRLSAEDGSELLKEIGQSRETVRIIDQSEFLTESMIERIHWMEKQSYRDLDGLVYPWLTSDEAECLLIKKGTLTEEERQIMESHVVATERLLAQIHFSKDYCHVPLWASGHHEFLNGTGYPKKISGDDIPYEVRLITILDIFDALTAIDRPYKKGVPIDETLDILLEMAGNGKLDQHLVRQFCASKCWEWKYN